MWHPLVLPCRLHPSIQTFRTIISCRNNSLFSGEILAGGSIIAYSLHRTFVMRQLTLAVLLLAALTVSPVHAQHWYGGLTTGFTHSSRAKIVPQNAASAFDSYLDDGIYASINVGYAGFGKKKLRRLEGELAWRRNGITEDNTTYSLSMNQLWINTYRDIDLGCTTKPVLYLGSGAGLLISKFKIKSRTVSETSSDTIFGLQNTVGLYDRLTDKLLYDVRYRWVFPLSSYNLSSPTGKLTGLGYQSFTVSLRYLF